LTARANFPARCARKSTENIPNLFAPACAPRLCRKPGEQPDRAPSTPRAVAVYQSPSARRALRCLRRGETLRPCAISTASPRANRPSATSPARCANLTGNMPMLPGVFPDYSAPIARTAKDGVRKLAMARWGMPSPAFAVAGRKSDPGVTNIRNVASPHWGIGSSERRVRIRPCRANFHVWACNAIRTDWRGGALRARGRPCRARRSCGC
jgi:hypothetical protein